jgi:isopentenyl-diphosphate delta-isomerase
MAEELVILVDESGQPIGTAGKFAAHHGATELHLAFSCYVFNDKGQLLVTQRARTKKVWPGVWSNSCCGHPAPRPTHHTSKTETLREVWGIEPMEEAIRRRLDHELGMTAKDITVAVADYTYKTPPFEGVIEHEYCPVYVARAASSVFPNSKEVEAHKWIPWEEYAAATQADTGHTWSWWCKDQLKHLRDNPLILQYAQGV